MSAGGDGPMADLLHRAHPKHPEHPDNHPHRAHHPHAKNLRGILAVYTLIVVAVLFIVGLGTNAPFGHVLLGFAPALLLGLVAVSLLNTDHFDIRLLLVTLIALIVLLVVALPLMAPGADVASLAMLNLLLGGLLLVVLAVSPREEQNQRVVEVAAEEQDVPTILATIEDRCKAINFVIGRVYNVHHGATAGMRDKIKIDSEWYNELSQAMEDPEENHEAVSDAVQLIKDRLSAMHYPEAEVFSAPELSRLKGLERSADGSSTVVHVLSRNDQDPIEQYLVSAEEYCDLVLARMSD